MGRGRLDTGERIVKKRERTKAKRRKRRRKNKKGPIFIFPKYQSRCFWSVILKIPTNNLFLIFRFPNAGMDMISDP